MIVIKDTDWFLIQFTGTDHEVMHGPFETEARAWKYLFGRDPGPEELELHKNSKWSVRQVGETTCARG